MTTSTKVVLSICMTPHRPRVQSRVAREHMVPCAYPIYELGRSAVRCAKSAEQEVVRTDQTGLQHPSGARRRVPFPPLVSSRIVRRSDGLVQLTIFLIRRTQPVECSAKKLCDPLAKRGGIGGRGRMQRPGPRVAAHVCHPDHRPDGAKPGRGGNRAKARRCLCAMSSFRDTNPAKTRLSAR